MSTTCASITTMRSKCSDASIAPSALDEVRIYFPDPWPKKRHQKRRLIQPDFVALLASRIAPGGRLHLATDWADYAEHMQSVLENAPEWRRHAAACDVRVAAGLAHRHAFRTPRPAARPRRLGSGL